MPWRTFVATWFVLGLVVFVPRYQDDLLVNAYPLLDGYLSWALDGMKAVPRLPATFVAHVVTSLALAACIDACRRRLSHAHAVKAGAVGAGVLVGLFAWAVHEYWPDGIYFDAHTTYYDVADLVDSSPSRAAGFSGASDLAEHVFAQGAARHERELPDYIGTISGSTTIIAWGTWPEHLRLRKALDAYRDP